jgi:nicotinamide-nucleotide amidase
VTGIAGPDGGSPEKPVGTVWIAVASGRGVVAEKHNFADNRIINISRSATTAINMLRKQIISR